METSAPFLHPDSLPFFDAALGMIEYNTPIRAPSALTLLDTALYRLAACRRRSEALVRLAEAMPLIVAAWYGDSLTAVQATEIATREAAHLGLSLPLATSVMVAVWESRLAYGVDMHREHRAVARLVGNPQNIAA